MTSGQSDDTYIIQYIDYDGTVLQTAEYKFGEDLSDFTAPNEPTREGYTFIGWDYSLPTTMPEDGIEIKALYSVNTYTITFDSNQGSHVDSITQEFGTVISAPQEPTRNGYTFVGWSSFESLTHAEDYVFTTMPAHDMTLYANWSLVSYDITYHLGDGENGNNPSNYTVESEKIVLDNPTKIGYTFNGWYDNSRFEGEAIKEILIGTTGDIELYAKWDEVQYTVTYAMFDSNYDPLDSIVLEMGEIITKLVVGDAHSIVLTSFGRLFTWGLNNYGMLGIEENEHQYVPVDITANFLLHNGEMIEQIALGAYHSSVVTSEGRMFIWGSNTNGQLGIGTEEYVSFPVDLTPKFNLEEGETIIQSSLGQVHSSALTSTGRIFTWGWNEYYQLGDGTTNDWFEPNEITKNFDFLDEEKIIQVSLGEFNSSILTSLGRVFSWGYNGDGQLGDGTRTTRSLPVNITSGFNLDIDETIIQISVDAYNGSALSSSGRVFTWGWNNYSQLGDGTGDDKNFPVDITMNFNLTGQEEIIQVEMGYTHSSALSSTGRVFTWGANGNGRLGDGTTMHKLYPTDITENFALGSNDIITSLSLGSYHSAALSSSGRVFAWGYNYQGQLGDGTDIDRHYPNEVGFSNINIIEEVVYNYHDNILLPEEPLMDGYIFDGWYSDASLTTIYNFSTMPAENIVLYGKWIKN